MLPGIILRLLSIEDEYESPFAIYPPDKHMYFHSVLMYEDATAILVVYESIL